MRETTPLGLPHPALLQPYRLSPGIIPTLQVGKLRLTLSALGHRAQTAFWKSRAPGVSLRRPIASFLAAGPLFDLELQPAISHNAAQGAGLCGVPSCFLLSVAQSLGALGLCASGRWVRPGGAPVRGKPSAPHSGPPLCPGFPVASGQATGLKAS